jgi:hypothetical protein
LEAGGEGAEEGEGGVGAVGEFLPVEDGVQGVALFRGETIEEVLQLAGEDGAEEDGPELGEDGLEGDEGFEGVAGADVEGDGDLLEVKGHLGGVGGEPAGQAGELGRGQGMGVGAGLDGVEVAGRGASAARAKLGIAVGTAAGMATHGPVAAARDGAADFVRVRGHGCLLGSYYSTDVRFCQAGDWEIGEKLQVAGCKLQVASGRLHTAGGELGIGDWVLGIGYSLGRNGCATDKRMQPACSRTMRQVLVRGEA